MKALWKRMAWLIVFAMILAFSSPALAGTKWTHDKAGAGTQVAWMLPVDGDTHERKAYWVFDAVERSNWIRVPNGLHGHFCVTADTADELGNGVQVNLLRSLLGADETPDANFSAVVLGLTLTGEGSNRCIDNLPPGWYLGDSLLNPAIAAGMASMKTTKGH